MVKTPKIIILFVIFWINTAFFASTFSGIPKYIPKKNQKKQTIRDIDNRGLIVKKYHKAGRNIKDSLGLSRGLSAHKFHKSGRRRGMAIGLSRGLNVKQFHRSGKRKGLSLGLSRGLNVSQFHKSGREKRSSLGLSRGLNVGQFHKSGRRENVFLGVSRGLNVRQFHKSGRRDNDYYALSRGLNVRNFHKSGRENGIGIGLSRGLNVRDYHKAGRQNITSIGLSRGQLENEIGNFSIENINTSYNHSDLNTYLFLNIRNEKPIMHYLATSDKCFDVNFQTKQKDNPPSKSQQKIPFITPLSPDHVGFTTSNTPEVYWYISSPWNGILEFTINEVDTLNPEPVLYARIKGVEKKGIYSFNLKELNVSLKENLEYEFFIAIIMDEIEKSANIVASSVIKYIKADKSFVMKMTKIPLAKDYYLYAKNGFFYDAIDHLSKVIIQSGFDDHFKCHRASLLRQVGLDKTAQYDCAK